MNPMYQPRTLHELIIDSEKIVYGEIIDLDSTHFVIKIKGSLTGESGYLSVKKFINWTCASRWTEYEKGQNLLLFLKTWDNELVSMGAGNEGELPIVNNDIYINAISLMYVNGDQNDWNNFDSTFEGIRYKVYKGNFYGTKMELSEFIKTAQYIRQCFMIQYGEYHEIAKFEYKCELAEIKKKANNSILLNAVLKEAMERIYE